jgi:hypothetical protein
MYDRTSLRCLKLKSISLVRGVALSNNKTNPRSVMSGRSSKPPLMDEMFQCCALVVIIICVVCRTSGSDN